MTSAETPNSRPFIEVDRIFAETADAITETYGKPAVSAAPGRLKGAWRWTAVWFIDNHNCGFHIDVSEHGHIEVETWEATGSISRLYAMFRTPEDVESNLWSLLPPVLRKGHLSQQERDLTTLAVVGRMYLDSLESDPENELLTAFEASMVENIREAVERQEARADH